MAALNRHHRKLIVDSSNDTAAAQLCNLQCDPDENPTGFCLPTCSDVCPSFCRTVDLCAPPPQAAVNPPSEHHHAPLSLPLQISVVVLVATFSLFLLYTLYKFYTVWNRSRRRHRTRQPPWPDNQETHDEFLDHDVLDHPIWYIRTIGLQPSVISAITVVKFRKHDGVIESTDCPVCLSEFREDENLRLLPNCNHAFHITCIDTWLRSHTNCPLCRAGIVNNTFDPPPAEQNTDDLGVTEETQMPISITEDADEADDDSELRIGRTREESQNNMVKAVIIGGGNSDFSMMKRSISLDDLAAPRISCDVAHHHEIQFQSVHRNLGIEPVKVDRTRDDNSPKKEGDNNDQNRNFLRLVGSSSIGRSLQIGPGFMRRSSSCGGKVWVSKHSSGRDKP